MAKSAGKEQEPKHPAPPLPSPPAGLPVWVTIIVVFVLLGLLGYSVVVIGPEGLPITYALGGLLGIYGGANELVKAARNQRNGGGEDK